MKRSKWKGLFIQKFLLNKNFDEKQKKIVWSRSSTIPESLIGHYVHIHNGKDFKKTFITREKVGFKFGEFSFTRKFTKKTKKR
jgi:small subunit ribosomal protein S19